MLINILENKRGLLLNSAKFATLIVIVLLTPLIGNQGITGSIVNATLFIATIMLGYRSAIAVGLIPSLIALMSGTLPAVLAPMVPFIIASNAILILVFEVVRKKNYWFGITLASFCKFIFLWGSSSLLISFLYKGQIAKIILSIMSYPQLITALVGGIIAYIFLKSIAKNDIKPF